MLLAGDMPELAPATQDAYRPPTTEAPSIVDESSVFVDRMSDVSADANSKKLVPEASVGNTAVQLTPTSPEPSLPHLPPRGGNSDDDDDDNYGGFYNDDASTDAEEEQQQQQVEEEEEEEDATLEPVKTDVDSVCLESVPEFSFFGGVPHIMLLFPNFFLPTTSIWINA